MSRRRRVGTSSCRDVVATAVKHRHELSYDIPPCVRLTRLSARFQRRACAHEPVRGIQLIVAAFLKSREYRRQSHSARRSTMPERHNSVARIAWISTDCNHAARSCRREIDRAVIGDSRRGIRESCIFNDTCNGICYKDLGVLLRLYSRLNDTLLGYIYANRWQDALIKFVNWKVEWNDDTTNVSFTGLV